MGALLVLCYGLCNIFLIGCIVVLLSFTRRKKRLSVSVDGKGRNEIVNIVAGREEKEKSRFGERATTYATGK